MQRSLRSKAGYTLIFSLITLCSTAQVFQEEDASLLLKKDFLSDKFTERKVAFGFGKQHFFPNVIIAPPLFIYQKFLSPQISASCLFNPTCSVYSRELFKRFGTCKAFLSTVDRIMRCDRISATDIPEILIDPVDHKKHESTDYYNNF